jgi:tight adherence protein C
MDETDHRRVMTAFRLIVTIGSLLLVVLIGARLRPKANPRAPSSTATTRTGGWPWIVVASIAAFASIFLGLIVIVVSLFVRRWSGIRRKARATREVAASFPNALDLLVLSIRAGYLPAQAISEITPYLPTALLPSFSAVDQALRRGNRFADALDQLRVRLGPIAEPLVDSLAAADRYGLPLAPVLERLSFEARQQRRRDTDAAARELPVRLALPLVLCTLPSFVLLAIVPLLLGALSALHT